MTLSSIFRDILDNLGSESELIELIAVYGVRVNRAADLMEARMVYSGALAKYVPLRPA